MSGSDTGPSDWPYSTRYECTASGCNYSHLLKKHPETGPVTVWAGCDWCGSQTRQKAVGRSTQLAPLAERESATARTDRLDKIVHRLRSNDYPVVPESDVIQAIRVVASADPETVDTYLQDLRDGEELFKHPTDNVWVTEREIWENWCDAHDTTEATASS